MYYFDGNNKVALSSPTVVPNGLAGGELGYDGDYQDDFAVELDSPGWYTVTGDFGILNGSLSLMQGKKTVASGTIKNGAGNVIMLSCGAIIPVSPV